MHVTNAQAKTEKILGLLKGASEQLAAQCSVEAREDGSQLIYGPFPSFLILVPEFGDARALVHVNADAPNVVYAFSKLGSEIVFDAPFAVDSNTGELIVGEAAYAKKEENVLMFAQEILARRQEQKQQGIIVPEKKIVLS